jgi:hypothetical protein
MTPNAIHVAAGSPIADLAAGYILVRARAVFLATTIASIRLTTALSIIWMPNATGTPSARPVAETRALSEATINSVKTGKRIEVRTDSRTKFATRRLGLPSIELPAIDRATLLKS